MSNLVYPGGLPGEGYPIVRTPTWSKIIATSQNGREVRISNYTYPRHLWEIPYSVLFFNDPHNNSDSYALTLQTLMGFFNQVLGAWDTFRYQDEDDYATINPTSGARVPTQIGVGDGATTQFQIGRNLGGFFEPLYDVNDAAYAHKIYLNAVLTSAYTISSSGLITFTSAPGSGVVITADFNYWWRVRFMDDTLDFSRFAYKMYEVKRVRLFQARS